MTGSIGTRYQGPSFFRTHEQSLLLEQRRNKRGGRRACKPSLHLTVVLSKAALSGPSVCLRARAPCPLRVSCLRIARERSSRVPCWSISLDRAKRAAKAAGSGVPVHHPPGSRGRAARDAGLCSGGSLGQDKGDSDFLGIWPRGAPLFGRNVQQVTLLNICSLETYWTQPSPSRHAQPISPMD